LCEELEPEDDGDDGSNWLAALTPLRADVLGGDLRLFYLLWLRAVEAEAIEMDEVEPLPGIGPMTGALDAFARFFRLDADLVAAAAERPAASMGEISLSSDVVRRSVAALPDREKTTLLARLVEGDPHVASELRARVRDCSALETSAARSAIAPRTVGELRARAGAIREARERKQSERREAEGNDWRRKRHALAAPDSRQSCGGATKSGARWRPKSRVATRPATTKLPVFSAISRRSPRNEGSPRISFAVCTQSVGAMPAKSASSNG
jgi:hypothetical protein